MVATPRSVARAPTKLNCCAFSPQQQPLLGSDMSIMSVCRYNRYVCRYDRYVCRYVDIYSHTTG